jgi:hypothetical protein
VLPGWGGVVVARRGVVTGVERGGADEGHGRGRCARDPLLGTHQPGGPRNGWYVLKVVERTVVARFRAA